MTTRPLFSEFEPDNRVFELGDRVLYTYGDNSSHKDRVGTVIDIVSRCGDYKCPLIRVEFDEFDRATYFSYKLTILPLTLEQAVYKKLTGKYLCPVK
jgi:hypothetical protein